MNGELMDALSTDFKGINQVVRFRWACLMLALKLQDDDTSKSRLRDSDIRKIGRDKALFIKVSEADETMKTVNDLAYRVDPSHRQFVDHQLRVFEVSVAAFVLGYTIKGEKPAKSVGNLGWRLVQCILNETNFKLTDEFDSFVDKDDVKTDKTTDKDADKRDDTSVFRSNNDDITLSILNGKSLNINDTVVKKKKDADDAQVHMVIASASKGIVKLIDEDGNEESMSIEEVS